MEYFRSKTPITAFPYSLANSTHSVRAVRRLCFPIHEDATIHTYGASAAIYQAVLMLGIEAGQNVLCPAYNCGHEIEPILRLGVNVRFYSVTGRLNPDLHHLRSQVDGNTRGILVTHYFGFPQDLTLIRELCDDLGLYLIEDCAHALFTRFHGRSVGTTGDAAVFSPRKTVPIPHGGLLILNTKPLNPDILHQLRDPPPWSVASGWLDFLARTFRGTMCRRQGAWRATIGLAALLPLFVARRFARRIWFGDAIAWYDIDSEDFTVDERAYSMRMADSVKRCLIDVDCDRIAASRRRNFSYLLEHIGFSESIHPLFTNLDDECCPLFFPILCDDPFGFEKHMTGEGVSVIPWWRNFHAAFPVDQFPMEVSLKERVVALPVHQDLTNQDLKTIARAVNGLSLCHRCSPSTKRGFRSG